MTGDRSATPMAFVEGYQAIFDSFLAQVDDQTRSQLDERTRHIVRLAALIACDATTAYPALLAAALDRGHLSPAEVGEVVVHAVPYVGMGRADSFARLTTEALAAREGERPLSSQATVTATGRGKSGLAVQRRIMGADFIEAGYANAPADQRHLPLWLSENCFGDHYTRGALDVPTRELITLVLLSALGGADAQVAAHVTGNLNVGNGRPVMTAAITAVLPWIGYPRTLNALRAIDHGTTRPGDA